MLQYPYPKTAQNLTMNQLQPITSPSQFNNRILPTAMNGLGSCGCSGCGPGCNCARCRGSLGGLGAILMPPTSRNAVGVGALVTAEMEEVMPTWAWYAHAALQTTMVAVGAYHGYKRNGTVLSAIGYGLLGGVFPLIGAPVMLVQGVAEPA